MKNEDKSILDEERFWKKEELTNRQLAGLIQSKVRYPNYILSKIETEINRRHLSKNDLLNQSLGLKNENTLKENFLLFWKKNKLVLIILMLISPFPFGSLIIIFSIYFSLKRFSTTFRLNLPKT